MSSEFRDGIFINGLWQSGSSAVWTTFRNAEGACCYHEPLNPALIRLTQKRIARAENNKPSFAEYAPLLKPWRGVKHYRRRFAYDRFAMTAADNDLQMKNYIAQLCEHARGNGKIPVLGFKRTTLRLQWLRRNFNPFLLHIDRAPRDIWASYSNMAAAGDFTPLLTWLVIIERNADNLLFRPLAEKLQLRNRLEKLYQKHKRFYRNALDTITPQETYEITFYIWCASILHALSESHLVMDIGLTGHESYAVHCAGQVTRATGLHVNLSVLQPDKARHTAIDFAAIENAVMRYFPGHGFGSFINRSRILARLGEISREKALMLERLV